MQYLKPPCKAKGLNAPVSSAAVLLSKSRDLRDGVPPANKTCELRSKEASAGLG